MNSRHTIVLILTIAALSTRAAMASEIAWTDVTIRVYDVTELPALELRSALNVASATLTAAGVEPGWHECPVEPTRRSRVCDTPLRMGELAIRIVRSPAGTNTAAAVALGDSFVDAHTRRGVLGTLYIDRVQRLAAAAGSDVATLLGRALAHELGHLLAATTAHGKYGLMRAVWSRDEIKQGGTAAWSFSKPDIDAIQRRLRANRMIALTGTH